MIRRVVALLVRGWETCDMTQRSVEFCRFGKAGMVRRRKTSPWGPLGKVSGKMMVSLVPLGSLFLILDFKVEAIVLGQRSVRKGVGGLGGSEGVLKAFSEFGLFNFEFSMVPFKMVGGGHGMALALKARIVPREKIGR